MKPTRRDVLALGGGAVASVFFTPIPWSCWTTSPPGPKTGRGFRSRSKVRWSGKRAPARCARPPAGCA